MGNSSNSWNTFSLGTVTNEIRTKVKDQLLPVLSAIKTGKLVLSDDYFTKQVYSKNIGNYIVVKPNEFAYNPARINIGSLGINDFEFSGCVSPVYTVFRSEPEYHNFLSCFFKTPNFQEEVRIRASGSVRQSLNYNEFSQIQLVYPPVGIVREFNVIYEKLLDNKNHLDMENTRLLEIRDVLLTSLMSGELSLTDIGFDNSK